jgi:SAM-dependent methyltransferase
MPSAEADLLGAVAAYYKSKLAEHGETARGVDWNSDQSQTKRFEQLCRIIQATDGFSVNDLGCGYGALYDYLKRHYRSFAYCGIDISDSMIETARRRSGESGDARFVQASRPDRVADYGIASGIFNVRLACGQDDWQRHIEDSLDALDRTSRLGFSFNCLTSYSDVDKMRDYLHYADPLAIFDRCMRRYARNVALLHDYGLYEFTILVRKQA